MDPFDPEAFRAHAHRTVDLLADHLRDVARGPVLPWRAPEASVRAFPADFASPDPAAADALLAEAVRASNHLHHPRYVGHQVTSPLPLAATCDFVAALLNNGGAVYEMGPVTVAMERALLGWFGARLGFGEGADGVFTSGGSAGNLTALLAARQARAGFDAWSEGAHAGPKLAVLASEQTHYCVQRSVQIMGWGEAGVAKVPVDASFRMRPDALAAAQAQAERAGRKVIAVVASAGSTSTGAFDPLDAVADYCEARGLWMHVDGAHGASVALSPAYRAKIEGIERADSVVWDAHKLLLMPALVTMVLFRDGRRSYEAFSQEASYLFAQRHEDHWFDPAVRTLECTKRMMALKVYVALATYGAAYFGDYVTQMIDRARRFASMLRDAGDFEVPVEPENDIVCFRYVGDAEARDGAALDALQARIRARLVETGAFYLVQTRLPTGVHLRTTIINPATTDADLAALIEAVRAAAAGRNTAFHDPERA